jgi:5-methylcytosine-specific restriction protein A
MFDVGRRYRRGDIHDMYGGQEQGGISTPAAHPIVLCISGDEGAAFGYADKELDDGTFLYFGEGQEGDMTFDRSNNRAIRDHAANGEELHVFRKVRDGFIEYMNQYDCAGYELRENVPDRNGNLRVGIVFQLVPHDQLVEDASEDGEAAAGIDLGDLDTLRAAALEPPPEGDTPGDARRNVYRRSRAVRGYVLLRAAGNCEGCMQAAPFWRRDGSPYLEPHHIRRRSDAGPDHPRWVVALCPTCHARVHHANDGEAYNADLASKVGRLEVL